MSKEKISMLGFVYFAKKLFMKNRCTFWNKTRLIIGMHETFFALKRKYRAPKNAEIRFIKFGKRGLL